MIDSKLLCFGCLQPMNGSFLHRGDLDLDYCIAPGYVDLRCAIAEEVYPANRGVVLVLVIGLLTYKLVGRKLREE